MLPGLITLGQLIQANGNWNSGATLFMVKQEWLRPRDSTAIGRSRMQQPCFAPC